MVDLKNLSLIIALAPLVGSIIAGIFGPKIGKRGAHTITILGMIIAFILSLIVGKAIFIDHVNPFNDTIYTWGVSGAYRFDIGFMIDRLSSLLMIVVTFVSLMVHIYSIGYMNDDPGYQRFFCYMSLFTFFMLMLVMANNFLQLFFGWEGVGLVSYLLIGFWYKKESANVGSLKAFIVNRIGDLGFIVGIAAILDYCNTLDYSTVFTQASYLASTSIQVLPGLHWSLLSVICILLFIGAMGKSAQMPLHVWLPESMEGPTPISALIHAATMVTAGIFMVARLSPLFAYSEAALSFMLVIGASTALFTGILGLVQYDIKRVIAYSTLSQLGYMVAALGASAFSAGIFHLVTHAFFKALLFLAAGSVIVALHHEQDMRKMGGLRKYMPVTYVTFLIGGLALSAIPPFAGFYSKDIIIDAVHLTTIPGATYAYVCLLLGAFVTALYTFRAVFYAFHTEERFDDHVKSHLKESPWVIWVPLILLAIPSVLSGALLVSKLIYGAPGLLGNTVTENPSLNVLKIMTHEYHGAINSIWQAFSSLPLWFALAGIFTAWVCYIAVPSLPGKVVAHFKLIYRILIHKYGFDAFNQKVFVQGTQKLSDMLFKICDVKFIDDWFINGSGRLINWLSSSTRRLQTGYIYHYTMVMVCGLIVFLVWLFW